MNIDKLIENGEKLPSAAKVLAVSSYKQFINKYPIIEKIKPEHWDFVLTIAGIFVAVSQLNHENIPEQDKNAILDTVTSAAIEIYPNSIEACEDCRNFVDRTYNELAREKEYKDNSKFLFSDSLGSWMVWNLFGHASSNEDERNLIRILGGFLAHSFISWWK
ncbi:MAG: hypothetical protein COS29_05700 [Candidatus Omnitrophica bacterium CG02_land_8_20_14_3_00__42_8]|nr:MAG: hypothetical protein COS29_05700 [Candidatus Omnitrophica bacterium CG02_land_8_20_14_3_00__42_8]